MKKPETSRVRVSNSILMLFGAFVLLVAGPAAAQAATRTWDGGGANSNWTTAANWVGDIAPVAGDDLIFPAGSAQTTNNNNFTFLTRFNSITITGGDYVLSGNPVNLAAGIKAESGTQVVNIPINMTAPQAFTTGDGAILTVTILVNTNGHLLTLDGTGGTAIIGLISGSGGVTKDGLGGALLANSNSYTGPTTVAGGLLIIDGSQPNSVVNVTGGALGGTGTTGAINVTAGALGAGTITSPTGVLSARGNIKLSAASAFAVKLNGTTPGSGHDQLNVNGQVDLGGSGLLPVSLPEFTPTVGDTFVIIANDGTEPVVGTFEGLPEGTSFAGPDGNFFRVNYAGGTGNDVVLTSVAPPSDIAIVQFSAATYTVGEGAGRATLTVTRSGNTSAAATVDYRSTDTDTFTVGCSDTVNNRGSAYARCDFATVVGTLSFAAGETSKQFTVPVIDDGHAEGSETFQVVLSNPAAGISLGALRAAAVTITDNDAAGAPNPIITTNPTLYPFFVRQQYLDFLSREPEAAEPWTGVMNRCPNVNTGPAVSTDCDRIAVSGAFFGSPEFQLKGFYVFRFYRLAFNRLPEYLEIVSDMSFVAGQTAEEVYARKALLAQQFTQRPEFQTAYAGLTNQQYVAALLSRYQLSEVTTPDPQQPDGSVKVTLTQAELVTRLTAGTLTRAQVFRAVADSDQVNGAEFNKAFIAMQYYGYLRRKPEQAGFDANLGALERGVSFREIVNAFLNSTEYKLRFGQP